MFVPVVTTSHHGSTTVINKTIVYSDTVFSVCKVKFFGAVKKVK